MNRRAPVPSPPHAAAPRGSARHLGILILPVVNLIGGVLIPAMTIPALRYRDEPAAG